MPLYKYSSGLLKLSTGSVLASGVNCCCQQVPNCKCCANGQYPPAWTVRVVGIVESDVCESRGDNCTTLNRIYVFYGISSASCTGNDNWCYISENLSLSSGELQFCGYNWGGYATLLWEVFRAQDGTYSVRIVFEVYVYTSATKESTELALNAEFTRSDLSSTTGPACGVSIGYKDAASSQQFASSGMCNLDLGSTFNVVLFPMA